MVIAPPDDVFEELARIAGIPSTNLPTFAQDVRLRIRKAWILSYYFIDKENEEKEPLRQLESAMETVDAAGRDLLAAARAWASSLLMLADAGKNLVSLKQSVRWQERNAFLEKHLHEIAPQTSVAANWHNRNKATHTFSSTAANRNRGKRDGSKESRFINAALFLAKQENPPIPRLPQRTSRRRGRSTKNTTLAGPEPCASSRHICRRASKLYPAMQRPPHMPNGKLVVGRGEKSNEQNNYSPYCDSWGFAMCPTTRVAYHVKAAHAQTSKDSGGS